jgi:hypothetical protein
MSDVEHEIAMEQQQLKLAQQRAANANRQEQEDAKIQELLRLKQKIIAERR